MCCCSIRCYCQFLTNINNLIRASIFVARFSSKSGCLFFVPKVVSVKLLSSDQRAVLIFVIAYLWWPETPQLNYTPTYLKSDKTGGDWRATWCVTAELTSRYRWCASRWLVAKTKNWNNCATHLRPPSQCSWVPPQSLQHDNDVASCV